MHTNALLISEIVRQICFLLGPYPPSWRPHRGKRDLANLARTSTVFLDAALDVLWECQEGLVNILKCMPVDVLDGPIRRGSLDTLNVTRPITAADWERPLFYLSRVRKFSGGRPRDTGGTKLFLDLCSSLPTRHWFPNLRFLEWCCYEPILLPGFFTMLTSSTTKLVVTSVGSGGDLSKLAFRQDGQCLTDVSIQCRLLGADAFGTRVSSFVRLLGRIERLRIHDLDQAAFDHLAMLPNLKSLKIDNLGEIGSPNACSQLNGRPFSGLQMLKISTGSVQTVLAVISSVSGPLASVDIEVGDCDHTTPLAEVSKLFAALGSTTCQLRDLRIIMAPDNQAPSYRQNLNVALEHLFSLRSLEKLWLEMIEGWDLDNALALAMARAWPDLTSLTMAPNLPDQITSRVTLTGLRAFSLHCPKLSYLGLCIDARVPLEEPLPTAEDVHFTLNALHIGHSPIANSSAVSVLLFSMYPGLSRILTGSRATPHWQSYTIREVTEESDRAEEELERRLRTFDRRWERVEKKLAERRRAPSESE